MARLALSTLKLIVAELNLLVRKNKSKILKYLEMSFKEIMENAFQPFVSVKNPPRMKKWDPRNLLNSTFEFKDNTLHIEGVVKHTML